MSNYIQVNSEKTDIRFIDVDELPHVRLVAYDSLRCYQIRISLIVGKHHFFQSTIVSPQELIHEISEWREGVPCVVIRSIDSCLDLTIDNVDLYLAICELFDMPAHDDVIAMFASKSANL